MKYMKEADTGARSWSNILEAFGQNKRHNLRIKRKKGGGKAKVVAVDEIRYMLQDDKTVIFVC